MKRHVALIGALLLSCGVSGSYASVPPPQIVTDSKTTVAVKGTIVDENGDPIMGASIAEIGTTRGTVSDAKGSFELKTANNAKLRISFLGYKTVELKAKSGMHVQMTPDNALLDEVVVVGYGQQKKVNLTGAVANVDIDKTLGSRPEQDVSKALQGAVPGLTVLSNNGDLNATPSLSIRGLGTLSNKQKSSPLIVVDGVPTDDLTMINGNDIASISVLKDASSSAIYGARAAFGVILITTKQAKKGDRVTVKYNGQMAWDQATVLPDFPSVPEQLEAGLIGKKRAGESTPELFGMYFDKLLPLAQDWEKQYGGKKGYSLMRPWKSDQEVGDYSFEGSPMYYANYDIRKIWYDNAAPSQTHDVSISGSSGRTTFYTSLGYDYKQDIMKFNPAKRNRHNATVNLQTDITDWLTAGVRFNYTRRHFSRADTWTDIHQYLWRWGSYFIPSGIYKDADGTEYDYRMIAMQKQASRYVIAHDVLRMNAFVKANITKELTLNADYTYQIDNFNSKTADHSVQGMNWSGKKPTYFVTSSNTSTNRWNRKNNRWTANAYLNYAHSFNDEHNLNVMAGVNGESFTSDYFGATRKLLYDENYPELNLAYGEMKDATIESETADRASAGYFGRINYDYKGIYLLELNGRYDGSSRFRSGDRWAFFPSFSLGYRFSEEAYWKNYRHIVSNGKLRFSYGEIGNEAIGDNMFLSTMTPYQVEPNSKFIWLNGSGAKVNGFTMPTWVNPSLTWERIQTKNLGLDLGFLNDEFTLTAEVYERLTKDMLAPGNAIPSAVGAGAPYTNGGELQARGWELSVAWRKQFSKDFGLYANFSIGDSKIKVKKWNNANKIIGHTNDVSYAYEGQTWGDIWGFETDRYFTEDDFESRNADGSWVYKKGIADQTGIQTGNFVYGPGDIKFKDLNHDGKIDGGKGTLEDHGDLKVIGNTLPRYEYSFHIGGTFKGFDLDLFFQGVGKRDVWTISAFNFPLMRNADLTLYKHQTKYNIYTWDADPDKKVVNIKQSNDYPCLWPGNEAAGNVSALSASKGSHNYYPQSRYLTRMSYLRLKNITLGYTLPKELTRKAYIQNLRVYVSANNLFLLHKGNGDLPVDPEINEGQGIKFGGWGRTQPITRTFAVGVQVTL
ncbi:TonB-dependent receptor [Segatella baroniae]|uniref:SusC/RagA family TonB-linked outer membrane protein n=1 Tax=Segatella baroniae TaxID=305719 RepID=UPI0028F0D40D|nr:TonB-dependent receptor [Segatella baroniae]